MSGTHFNNTFQVRRKPLGLAVAASGEQSVAISYVAERHEDTGSTEFAVAERVLLK